MGVFDFLRSSGSLLTKRTPLSPLEVRTMPAFEFVRTWGCKCGAELKIRAREDRSNAPSNWAPNTKLSPAQLTWDGLANERGWQTQPTKCPACQRGMAVAEYKDAKRRGAL